MDKIAALTEVLFADPSNAFARYGLAMEHASASQFDLALAEFDTLLQHHADYTPGYFMSAQTLLKAGRSADAVQRLKKGIASARRTGDAHAEGEMQALLDGVDC